MSIKETLVVDMKAAMRDKDTIRLETIRLLRAAIQRKEVDERVQLDDEYVLQIIQKMVKQCTDAAQQFSNGNREDLADKEKANISILETYLPEQLSEQEIETLIMKGNPVLGWQGRNQPLLSRPLLIHFISNILRE